jgi:ADP-ribosylglycohydrolase
MDSELMASKVRGCLEGVWLGDLIGMPWEAMSREAISEACGGGGVSGPLDDAHVTDDWGLTEACARSLARRGGFDLLDLALTHVAQYEGSMDGDRWGGTTAKAVSEIRRYLQTLGERGSSPYDARPPEPGRGRGNGVAMKASPFVLRAASGYLAQSGVLDPDRGPSLPGLTDQLMLLGRMTHSDPQASVAACCFAAFLGPVVLGHPAVTGAGVQERAAWLLSQAVLQADLLDDPGPAGFGSRLRALLDFGLLFGEPSRLGGEVGTGSDALESVPFAMAVFLRHPEDFRAGVLEAVNAGGDTDTTASMAGALIGANVGPDGIPPEWRDRITRDLGRLAHDLMP